MVADQPAKQFALDEGDERKEDQRRGAS
jgi:hypothetical protein